MPRAPSHAVTRKEALAAAALAAAGAAGGGALLGGPAPAVSRLAASDATDALNEILRIERVQAGLYAQAAESGAMPGELGRLATALADQEREHVAALTGLLGARAEPAPALRLGRAGRDPATFSRSARDLEDLAAHAYNVQAMRLSGAALREVLRIVSVEARHAAWIRDLRGELPAPDAVEPPTSGTDARAALARTGLLR